MFDNSQKTSPETMAALEATMLALVASGGPEGTISPPEVAIAIAGKEGDAWGALMPVVRKIAVRLANEGRLTIYRKGKHVDPNDFKGVYRLGPVRQD